MSWVGAAGLRAVRAGRCGACSGWLSRAALAAQLARRRRASWRVTRRGAEGEQGQAWVGGQLQDSKFRCRSPTTGWWKCLRPVRCRRTLWAAQRVRKGVAPGGQFADQAEGLVVGVAAGFGAQLGHAVVGGAFPVGPEVAGAGVEEGEPGVVDRRFAASRGRRRRVRTGPDPGCWRPRGPGGRCSRSPAPRSSSRAGAGWWAGPAGRGLAAGGPGVAARARSSRCACSASSSCSARARASSTLSETPLGRPAPAWRSTPR